MNLGCVESFRHVEMSGDEPVEQREYDEVEHDRHNDFMRAESRSQVTGHGTDNAARSAGGDHANRQCEYKRSAERERETHQRRGKSPRGELTFAADVEETGTQTK